MRGARLCEIFLENPSFPLSCSGRYILQLFFHTLRDVKQNVQEPKRPSSDQSSDYNHKYDTLLVNTAWHAHAMEGRKAWYDATLPQRPI